MMETETTSTKKQFIAIKSLTWLKESHSLFDYEYSKNIAKF